MAEAMGRVLLVLCVGAFGCEDVFPTGECRSGQTNPCSCVDQPVNGIQTCDNGSYGGCVCPEQAPPAPRIEDVQRSPIELARVNVVSMLGSIQGACTAEAGERPDLQRHFHASVPERMVRSSCAIDWRGISAFHQPCDDTPDRLCSSGGVVEAGTPDAERVGELPVANCYAFHAGEALVIGCEVEGRWLLVHHEGLESLRAPAEVTEEVVF